MKKIKNWFKRMLSNKKEEKHKNDKICINVNNFYNATKTNLLNDKVSKLDKFFMAFIEPYEKRGIIQITGLLKEFVFKKNNNVDFLYYIEPDKDDNSIQSIAIYLYGYFYILGFKNDELSIDNNLQQIYYLSINESIKKNKRVYLSNFLEDNNLYVTKIVKD